MNGETTWVDIDRVIAEVLTAPQRREINSLTSGGRSKLQAVRKLLRLGTLVRRYEGLETDLIHGTNFTGIQAAHERNGD